MFLFCYSHSDLFKLIQTSNLNYFSCYIYGSVKFLQSKWDFFMLFLTLRFIKNIRYTDL